MRIDFNPINSISSSDLTASTKILDKASGEITRGKIPAYSVVVPGVYSSGNVNLIYAVIVKQYDAETKKNFRK